MASYIETHESSARECLSQFLLINLKVMSGVVGSCQEGLTPDISQHRYPMNNGYLSAPLPPVGLCKLWIFWADVGVLPQKMALRLTESKSGQIRSSRHFVVPCNLQSALNSPFHVIEIMLFEMVSFGFKLLVYTGS